ncbi:MAG TPA: hypothetical protein VK524_23420 [Polyangiaceae bacterium]|nr:hypothetical protein [Polyangiaceae bacterium]
MIVSLSFGRWLALVGLLTLLLFTTGNPALAQTAKKPAAAAKAKKKKAPVRAEKPKPEPGDDLGEEAEEEAPKPKKQTRAEKAKAEKEKKAKAQKEKAENAKAEKEEKARAEKEAKAEKEKKAKEEKAAAAKGKGKGKGKGKKEAAKPPEQRFVVLPVDGPNGKKLRGYVVSALSKVEGVSDVSEEDSKRENSADAAIALANEQQAAAVVYGTAARKRGQYVLDVQIRSGTDGQVLGEASFKGASVAKLKQRIDNDLSIELADAIAQAKPAPEPEPEPEAEPTDEPEAVAKEEAEEEEPAAEEESAPVKGRPSPLEIWLGFRGFSRDFSYNEDLHQFNGSVQEQSTYGGPGVAGFLSLRWYPLAHFQGGVLSHIGLQGGYERGFLTRAKSPQGRELDVSYQEFMVGLRGRIPIGRHELGVSASFGQHEFTVQDDELLLPDVKYAYLRPAIDGRFRFGKGLAGFTLGYRNVMSAGQIQDDDWYPNSDVAGLDIGLFGGYTPTGSYDLMAGVDMRRYFYTMNSEPGDPRIAGGAVDQYLSFWLGVAWHLAGSDE